MRWMFMPTPELLPAEKTLAGSDEPVNPQPAPHAELGTPITGPWKEGQKSVLVGIGCFWGPERMFWEMDGVESTSVGYAGGATKNPSYGEVCTGRTNHVEVVEVVYDPERISLREIVAVGLEDHDPTQGYRQGNDVGTQYRSAFYTVGEDADADLELIREMVADYGTRLAEQGYGEVTTEMKRLVDTDAGEYYLAEDEHQQYLHKVPNGYCPSHATGVACAR
ncbi:peptide-methionine (S)-S-oxide reductase [Corynebacterium yudongzhengii]|uniref:Peptide methionine sulfoxide reductase MsrA n=1 Tax=Corynebacterium yudongzhengii TaxID=2080740 RepID=A0A2U1T8A8_9CORY|nr:peptide-methionine (S)-S-oxide reductase MsrA [Corynebacterium yudongzhengii]AWB83062.1 peptide-methionine (S)-S-oxide reductase [Corynebacterium yudongzhengii]PWC02219.1 peptide-methionine (S)-S-oxide reductase MsrA [Corynebacterium yudongzhengii]